VAHVPPKAESDFKHEDKVIVSEPPPRPEIPPAPSVAADDVSIPPVAANGVEAQELDHTFFAAGEKADQEHREAARRPQSQFPEIREDDPKAKQKMTPAVRERRARFTKYVKWAVAASAVVCLAALVRVAVARGQHEAEPAPVAVAANVQAAAPPLAPPQAPPAPPAAPAPAPAPAPAAAADQPAAPPAPANTAPAAAPATADTAAAEVPTDPAAAKEEKKAAQKALNRGDLKGAIEAGERAVAYDPTDGDAWLLLGAANLEKGKAAEARKAFTSCVKEGKRGAIGECRAMLR
jgi:2-oxoglutarate dehydrogenase E2 component (dihydrolipoamide succinyltransferase)